MKVLSLFDGISCGMVALERANINVREYVAYEIDNNCIKVSNYNYPWIVHKGDVFNARYDNEKFDLLIGGSPCTYWSISQTRKERELLSSGNGWDLFMEYVRALKETSPKYFLYENNDSISDYIKMKITEQLKVEPIIIDSADFSAQIRKRYYWTNIPVDLNYEKSKLVLKDILFEHNYKIKDHSKYKDTVKWNDEKTICRYDTSGKGHYSQQNRCRKITIKSNTLPSSGRDKNNIWIEDYKSRQIHPIEAERLQTLPDNYTSCIKSEAKRISLCGNGWTINVITYILRGIKNESSYN